MTALGNGNGNRAPAGLTLALPDETLEAIAQRVAEIVVDRRGAAADAWLNVEQAAEYMACAKHRVYDLVEQGRLVPGRDGRRLVFRRSALDAYLEGLA
jgi:excisionase family DNA binding protein